jgi:hypothetical protein
VKQEEAHAALLQQLLVQDRAMLEAMRAAGDGSQDQMGVAGLTND